MSKLKTKTQNQKSIKTLHDFKSSVERKAFLEKSLNISLKNIGAFTLVESVAGSRNCENMIGISQIPLGVAGPLKIIGETAKGEYYLPLATTEGALVASVNRGCKAITLSGGVKICSSRIGVTRGPVFYVRSLEENRKLRLWLTTNEEKLKKTARSTSNHLTYLKYEISGPANYIFVRFYFDTQDAMGMNMVTVATQRVVDLILKDTGIECLSVAGNFDTDKKPAWLNFINKRGIETWAEVIIPKDIVKTLLKTTPDKLFRVWLGKNMIGSAISGSLGFNGHFANITAAIFIATGQDPGHIGEASMGLTTAEIKTNGDFYFSVYLPDLMMGTVGGGTGLSTQKEALQLLGVYGGDSGKNSLRLAEITTGAVLAGELSLLASLSEGSLVRVHSKLARGGK